MSTPVLRFLADENCDFVVVRALCARGYDVVAVSEYQQRSDDAQLMELAAQQQRILITEDRDFGWLVFVTGADSAGVMLLRFPGSARESMAEIVVRTVREQGENLRGRFIVVQPGHVRMSRRP